MSMQNKFFEADVLDEILLERQEYSMRGDDATWILVDEWQQFSETLNPSAVIAMGFLWMSQAFIILLFSSSCFIVEYLFRECISFYYL